MNLFDKKYECEGQMSIFDILSQGTPHIKITKPVRLIELFGGIGSQAMALRDLGAPFEHYRLVEWDKYPVTSYNAIHGTKFEPTDITKINGDDLGVVDLHKWTYIMTYSFPCQDLSVAGLQRGMTKGSGTRSGLLWEVERLLSEMRELPQILVMENVPQVHSKANMPDFEKWLSFLESKGYTNFWRDLNSRNYGVAQNRNRCFCVSLRGNYKYQFPKEIPLDKRMKDYLEPEVDKKYYITTDKAQKLIDSLILNGRLFPEIEGGYRQLTSASRDRDLLNQQIASRQDMMQESVICRPMEAESVKQYGYIEKGTGQHQSNTIIDSDGLSPTLTAVNYKEPVKVLEWRKVKT